jgi:hypothetical protein
MCWGGEDGCAECSTIQCHVMHSAEIWCCDAKDFGHPYGGYHSDRTEMQINAVVKLDLTLQGADGGQPLALLAREIEIERSCSFSPAVCILMYK